jgi:hypothetical protein
MFGMSSKEFWEEDPQLYWAYRTFYLKKQEEDFKRDNEYMWLQGMYIYEGFSIALHNVFSNQKKHYTDKPYNLGGKEEMQKNIDIDKVVAKQNNAWSRLV